MLKKCMQFCREEDLELKARLLGCGFACMHKRLCTLPKVSKHIFHVFLAVSKTLACVGHLKRTWDDAFRIAGSIQETCSPEMLGGHGADFLRRMALWCIRSPGLLRWFCVAGAALRMTWFPFRGRGNTLDRWNGKIAKRIGTKPSALPCLKEVPHNCFVFDLCQLRNFRKSRRIVSSSLMLKSHEIHVLDTWESIVILFWIVKSKLTCFLIANSIVIPVLWLAKSNKTNFWMAKTTVILVFEVLKTRIFFCFGGRNKSHRRLLDVLPQETYTQRLGGLQSQLRALDDKVWWNNSSGGLVLGKMLISTNWGWVMVESCWINVADLKSKTFSCVVVVVVVVVHPLNLGIMEPLAQSSTTHFPAILMFTKIPKLVTQNGWFIMEHPLNIWVIWEYGGGGHQFRKPPSSC